MMQRAPRSNMKKKFSKKKLPMRMNVTKYNINPGEIPQVGPLSGPVKSSAKNMISGQPSRLDITNKVIIPVPTSSKLWS